MIVDASVGLKWFIGEVDAGLAERLSLEHDLIAPTLFVSELANGLWKATSRGVITQEQMLACIATLDVRIERYLPDQEVVERALEIAGKLDHPVYDCIYLAHCEREAVRLVTADQRLLRKLAGTAYVQHCVTLAELYP